MRLTVDCALSNSLLSQTNDSALGRLLSKAKVRQLDLPLEALICAQHGLAPNPDYPIAPMAAGADGLAAGDCYWLRADPVHLLLQRDSFSLSEPVPVSVEREHAELIIASLNQHFGRDGMRFCIGNSGAWYLRLELIPEIQTTLPSVALDRNVYPFLPQGAAASVWLAYLNEIQMLLHEHPANTERESRHQAAINSVWLSGGGVMPQPHLPENGIDMFIADNPLYHGLAKWSGLTIRHMESPLASLLQHVGHRQHARLELSGQHLSDDISFNVLWDALKARKIEKLTLNIGCYEKTLVAAIRPVDTYKFWRKRKPVGDYLK